MSGDVSTAEQVDQPESAPEQKPPTAQPQPSPYQSPNHSINPQTAEMMARSGAVSSPRVEGQTTRRGLLQATAGVATAAAATGALYGVAQMANGGTSFPASITESPPSFLSKIGSALRGFLPGFSQKHLDEMAKEAHQANTTPNIGNSGDSQTTIVPSGLPDTGHP